jgi:hypothetical protein
MSGVPIAPRMTRAGIVSVDPRSGQVLQIIPMQYNPDTVTRTLQPQGVTGEGADRSQALRLTAPPIETIKLDAEIDATDGLERPDEHPDMARQGIGPQLAALELLLYPPSGRMIANNALQASGTLEITPVEAPLTLFVWGSQRVVPVRLTDLSITEEAFDPQLNPLRARVSLSLRVLSVDDLGFEHRGGALYLGYQQARERLARRSPTAALSELGITGI